MVRDSIYAVIDTNVIISAILAKLKDAQDSCPNIVLQAVFNGEITPLFNQEILDEYQEVLSRDKFPIDEEDVKNVLDYFTCYGLFIDRKFAYEYFPDPKDKVFYEIAINFESSYLVTGNKKHFPNKGIVVSPAEMVDILRSKYSSSNNYYLSDYT